MNTAPGPDLLKTLNPLLWQCLKDCKERKSLLQATVPTARALFNELRDHFPAHVEIAHCDNCISVWPDADERQLVIMVMTDHIRFTTPTKNETYDLIEPDSIPKLIASVESSL